MARTRRSPRESIPPVHEIRQRLKRLARALLRQRGNFVRFTGDEKADRLLNDLKRAPHLFVIGSVADYQVKAEKAWSIPVALARRAGGKSFRQVNALSRRSIRAVIKGPPAMHRFPAAVADRIRRTLDRIESQYGGDASRIWAGRPSSALVVYRFLEFHGIGQKVANMATNILARSFGGEVKPSIGSRLEPPLRHDSHHGQAGRIDLPRIKIASVPATNSWQTQLAF